MTRILGRLVSVLVAVVLCGVAPAASPQLNPGDEWLAKPVDDRTFKSFLDLFTYDPKLPLDLRTIGNDEQGGIKREHLSYQSTPGIRVFGHLYHPLGAATETSPALIMLHGGGAAGKANLAPRARNLALAGFTVLALDADMIRATSVEPLFRLARAPKDILWSEGGHMAVSEQNHAQMVQWLRENVK